MLISETKFEVFSAFFSFLQWEHGKQDSSKLTCSGDNNSKLIHSLLYLRKKPYEVCTISMALCT